MFVSLRSLRLQTHAVTPPGWPIQGRLRIAALADPHVCRPWMSKDRLAEIVCRTNAAKPDLTVLLGDFEAGHRWGTGWLHARDWGPVYAKRVPSDQWAPVLAGLDAPLGVYAILGQS